jgi:hypothetical protein
VKSENEEGMHLDGEKARIADTIPALLLYEAGLIFAQSTTPRPGYPDGKYPDTADGVPNFKGGIRVTKIIDSMLRHVLSILCGEDIDPDSGFNHLSHIICNVSMAWYMIKHKPEMDNREVVVDDLAQLRGEDI